MTGKTEVGEVRVTVNSVSLTFLRPDISLTFGSGAFSGPSGPSGSSVATSA